MNREKLYRFFRGETSQKQEWKILQWLDRDPSNMEKFMRRRKTFDTLLLTGQNGDMRPMLHWVKELTRAAALVAIAACFGYWLSARHVSHLATLSTTVAAPAGQRVNITLPDGTGVWLNSLSSLSYPATFTKGRRSVKLTGEGFFDVVRDEKNPFTVHAGRYEVKVLGTKFNVVSLPSSNDFSVSVVEGRVEVKGDDSRSVVLNGDQMAFEAGNHLKKQEFFDTDAFLWREGVLSFRSTSFEKLLGRFEHNYGVRIIFEPSTLPKAVFSGKFRISDGISHALKVLQRDVPFYFRWDKEHNIIYINQITN